jgi:hypothetical protein
METQWYCIAPAVLVAAVPVDHQSCQVHDRDNYQRVRLLMIGTKRAVVIGCIALYKLAAFNTARRWPLGSRLPRSPDRADPSRPVHPGGHIATTSARRAVYGLFTRH